MNGFYEHLAQLEETGTPAVLITVTDSQNHTPARIGSKLLIEKGGEREGTVGGGRLEKLAQDHAADILAGKAQSGSITYLLNEEKSSCKAWTETEVDTGMVCGGRVTLFFEALNHETAVYLFGAGHVGQAIIKVFQDLPFRLKVVDCRDEMKQFMRDETALLIEDYATAFHDELSDGKHKGAIIVIAAHSHEWDYQLVRRSFTEGWEPSYIGLMSSRKKKDWLQNRLTEDLGFTPDLSHFYTPIGLDIGGRLPSEIAVSVAAEVLSVHYGRTGLPHLRDKAGKPEKK